MKNFTPPALRAVLMSIGAAISLNVGDAATADVVAVVAVTSPVSSLTKSQIADIFLRRKKRFPDGQAAVPIDQSEGSPARDEFYMRFAGKSPTQLKEHWSKAIFTGRGRPPQAVLSDADAKKAVAANPQAIAYIDRKLVDASVKVLHLP